MISSTIPSAKYSCSGSPLMFWNGSTAIDGLSGSGSEEANTGVVFGEVSPLDGTSNLGTSPTRSIDPPDARSEGFSAILRPACEPTRVRMPRNEIAAYGLGRALAEEAGHELELAYRNDPGFGNASAQGSVGWRPCSSKLPSC